VSDSVSDLSEVENLPLRSEFLRAINLVTTTQLTLFLDREPPTRESIVADFKQRLSSMDSSASESSQKTTSQIQSSAEISADPTTAVTANDKTQAKVMREVLLAAIGVFNDPFATYINPEQLKRYYNKRTGNLLGIGVKFRAFDDAYPVIIGPLLGGPLDQSAMEPADRIVEIAGSDQFGASSLAVSTALKGEKGTTVQLKLRRSDGEDYLLEATRSQIQLKYARSEMLDDKVGYLKISRFGGGTHTTVRALLEDLLKQGARRLVLDVRDNPGGSTRAARGVVSLFVDKQHVYCERYEAGGMRELPHEGEKLTDLPLAVLVNEASMSASEIVAGALQDYGRAIIVGAPTYGKGLIQKVFNLKAPLGGAVRTTIAAYATPSHTLIHGVGVTPDVFEPTAPRQLFRESGSLNISAAALKFKRKLLEERLRNDYEPEEAERLIAYKDAQLIRGIQELKA